ncbi:MAG: ankyrin repeat domain-containing protein [Bryobacteraceae bacterium]
MAAPAAAGLGLEAKVCKRCAERLQAEATEREAEKRRPGDEKRQATLVIKAAGRGDTEAVKVLLENDPELANADNGSLTSPLMEASYYGHAAVVKLLLEAGADRNFRHLISGDTPASLARKRGHSEVARLLGEVAQQAAKPGSQVMTCPVCGGQMIGGAPLTLSCSGGHDKISYYLFDDSFATLSSSIASLLKTKGYGVEKSTGGNHFNIHA